MKLLRQNLAEVMGIVGYVQKDGKNEAQRYKFASAEAVLKKVNAELSTRGIAISSTAETTYFNVTEYVNDQGKTRFRSDAVVKLALTFTSDLISVNEDTKETSIAREEITVQGLGQATDTGDKAVMKANTAAIKYCLTNAFLISWGDDPESAKSGDAPSDRPAPKKAATKKPAAKRSSESARDAKPKRPAPAKKPAKKDIKF